MKRENAFNSYQFQGTFREYQQRVLDSLDQHLEDGRIHIVAAPGSGKTILGLEIIRTLGFPALILSPTNTIQHQWGNRLEQNFGANKEDISFSLKEPSLITSSTYQALHSAMKRLKEEQEDYSDFDFYDMIHQAGIKVICVDEAHHLKQEWQKSLEEFIEAIQSEVFIIALTATPPYDSTLTEWNRYISVCGEIDEEISVPELVKANNLSPHQDFVYFNFPSETEKEVEQKLNQKAYDAINQLVKSGLLKDTTTWMKNYMDHLELILDSPEVFSSFLSIYHHHQITYPKQLVQIISPKGKLPPYNLETIDKAIIFCLNNPDIFGQKLIASIKSILKQYGFVDSLVSTPQQQRLLVQSIGKLDSIVEIVEHESSLLEDKLRLLVLTDYIRKDHLSYIGSEQPLQMLGVVPIFEALRRQVSPHVKLGALSGTLLILDTSLQDKVKEYFGNKNISYQIKDIENTTYFELVTNASSQDKVGFVTMMFEQGHIQILVGTKSLLGEGWDSPSINTLILASFVGSFMLSNQMRGRAIRTNPLDPQKVANIWHLVTLPSPTKANGQLTEGVGSDFETLERRFNNFLAPNFEGTSIEAGISRLDINKEKLNRDTIQQINQNMLEHSSQRQQIATHWNSLVGEEHENIQVVHRTQMETPQTMPMVQQAIIDNLLSSLIISVIFSLFLQFVLMKYIPFLQNIRIDHLYLIIFMFVFLVISNVLWVVLNKKRRLKAIASAITETLQSMKVINRWAKPSMSYNRDKTQIRFMLNKASDKESLIFNQAISEFFSLIDNPRYILIATNRFKQTNIFNSYACPSVIGTNEKQVKELINHLKERHILFDYQYTRTVQGRKTLLKARKSYRSRQHLFVNSQKVASLTGAFKDWE